MVRDLMLAAYDAGMTQSNEYVFIIIPTNYFPLYNWTAPDDGLFYDMSQRSRDEDARKAFQVARLSLIPENLCERKQGSIWY